MKWLAKAWGSKKVVWALFIVVTAGMFGLMIACMYTNLTNYIAGSLIAMPLVCVLAIRFRCLETKKTYAEFTEEIGKKDPLGKFGIKLQLGGMLVFPLSYGASIFLTDATVHLYLLLIMVLVAVLIAFHVGWTLARDVKKHFQRSGSASLGSIESQNSE